MTEKLGGKGLIKESCNGINLLMNKDKCGSLLKAKSVTSHCLGCNILRDDELVSMLKEGDYDGAFNPMEFCVGLILMGPNQFGLVRVKSRLRVRIMVHGAG
ncbi:hypothetical protein Hanom_Chr00s000004g01607301 [Helianthus anomalus]